MQSMSPASMRSGGEFDELRRNSLVLAERVDIVNFSQRECPTTREISLAFCRLARYTHGAARHWHGSDVLLLEDAS